MDCETILERWFKSENKDIMKLTDDQWDDLVGWFEDECYNFLSDKLMSGDFNESINNQIHILQE